MIEPDKVNSFDDLRRQLIRTNNDLVEKNRDLELSLERQAAVIAAEADEIISLNKRGLELEGQLDKANAEVKKLRELLDDYTEALGNATGELAKIRTRVKWTLKPDLAAVILGPDKQEATATDPAEDILTDPLPTCKGCGMKGCVSSHPERFVTTTIPTWETTCRNGGGP